MERADLGIGGRMSSGRLGGATGFSEAYRSRGGRVQRSRQRRRWTDPGGDLQLQGGLGGSGGRGCSQSLQQRGGSRGQQGIEESGKEDGVPVIGGDGETGGGPCKWDPCTGEGKEAGGWRAKMEESRRRGSGYRGGLGDGRRRTGRSEEVGVGNPARMMGRSLFIERGGGGSGGRRSGLIRWKKWGL